MIQKIISGGQTGVDQAALDAAIELGIAHGGWIPKGRLTEDGRLPEKYNLKEMPTTSHPKRTEQNVIDSHGTIIFSHGDLTSGSAYTQKMAIKHNRPILHLDLKKTNVFDASIKINRWIYGYEIEILNVAGTRFSKDPKIYHTVRIIIKAVIGMNISGISNIADLEEQIDNIPLTVDEAVERLISEMTLKDKTLMAKMDEDELSSLDFNLGGYIRDKFKMFSGNESLMNSCRVLLNKYAIKKNEASDIIIKELWKKLKESHRLRVVK